jgi:hypothetical protein
VRVLQILGASLASSFLFGCGVYCVAWAWEHDLLPRFPEHAVEHHPRFDAKDLAGFYGVELVLSPEGGYRHGVRVAFCGFCDPDGPGDIERWVKGSWRVDGNDVVLAPDDTNEPGSRLEVVRIDGDLDLVLNPGPRQRILLRD